MHYAYVFRVSKQNRDSNVLQNESFYENFPIGRDGGTYNERYLAYTDNESVIPPPEAFLDAYFQQFGGEIKPEVIKHSNTAYSNETSSGELSITVPRDFEISNLIRQDEDSLEVLVYIYKYGDLGQILNIFTGVVDSVSFEAISSTLKCSSFTKALSKTGLTQKFSRQCPYALFSRDCGVNKDQLSGEPAPFQFLYKFPTSLETLSLNGTELTIAEDDTRYPDDFYVNGYIQLATNEPGRDGTEYGVRRMILRKVGRVLTLAIPLTATPPGKALTLHAGCDKAIKTCKEKFNNVPNLGGFPYIPIKNVFTSHIEE